MPIAAICQTVDCRRKNCLDEGELIGIDVRLLKGDSIEKE